MTTEIVSRRCQVTGHDRAAEAVGAPRDLGVHDHVHSNYLTSRKSPDEMWGLEVGSNATWGVGKNSVTGGHLS